MPAIRRPARRSCGEQLASGEEVGASLAVVEHGKPVVDLWGGFADRDAHCPLGARHHHQRLVDHQDHDVPGRAHARRSRTARPRRARRDLLARVRPERQGRHHRQTGDVAHGRGQRMGDAVHPRAALRLRGSDLAPRRAGPVVGARHRIRLLAAQLRAHRRRDRASRLGQDPEVVRGRGDRRAARCRLHDRGAAKRLRRASAMSSRRPPRRWTCRSCPRGIPR